MFRVGQKVVCIETWSLNGTGYGDEIGPIEGKIYTIRSIGVGFNSHYPDRLQVRLVEISNESRLYGGDRAKYEPAFGAYRFRPVVERKTDISIFKAMLTPKRSNVRIHS